MKPDHQIEKDDRTDNWKDNQTVNWIWMVNQTDKSDR